MQLVIAEVPQLLLENTSIVNSLFPYAIVPCVIIF